MDANGVVTLVGKGRATITAKAVKNSRAKATVKLTVLDSTIPTGIKLTPSGKLDHDYRSPLQLSYELLPKGRAKSKVTFKSSNVNIARVSDSGLVTPLKVGRVTITATTENRKSAKVTLNIVDPTLPTGITLDKTGKVTLDVSEKLTLTATLLPKGTAVSDIQWKTSAPNIATVKDGVVTPLKAGTATITATATKNNKSARVKVVIKDLHAPKSVSIDQGSTLSLSVGQTKKLTATVKGESGYAPRISLTWTSKKPGVVRVDQDGNITAVAPGSAKITVTTDNGKKASITVKVSK